MTIQPLAGKFDFAMERKPEDDDDPTGRGRAGVQSVEVAARLLDVLAAASGALTLKDLAAKAQMSASKAHRYLVSLARTGLVEQDATGRYDLGIRALSVGLAALGRIDAVRIATDELERLSDDAGATEVSSSSPAIYTFTEAGSFTFACDVGEHCESGQILTFTVV